MNMCDKNGSCNDTSTFQPNNVDLGFQGSDPGAVRHGNFINYYSFHPASERFTEFPSDIWKLPQNLPATATCLDVGCNSGELTFEIHRLLSTYLHRDGDGSTSTPLLRSLGIELDPVLVQRAKDSSNPDHYLIEFAEADITSEICEELLQDFLSRCSVSHFSAVFLMSVTMWVHLVHGDEGLRRLLLRCAQLTDRWLVLEPQPWSCYRSAHRRLVRSGVPGFPLFSNLKIKGPQLLSYMHKLLTEECGFIRVHETAPSTWKRTISFYQKCDQM